MTTKNNYLALARKYRPSTFEELVGQSYTKQILINALNNNKLHHAFLFTGTRGVGKTTIARILAKSLNCQEGISSVPCNKCKSCLSIDNSSSIDVVEIDAASNTQVEKIRSLLDNAKYTPSESTFKIYIIDEVHMLSTSSFNALLKTIEEPPQHIKFIFATTDPQKIPVTVISRCLQFNLQILTIKELVKQMTNILNKEGIAFDIDAIEQIANLANGSMRDGLSILDQVVAFNDKIELTKINEMLGIVSTANISYLVDSILAKNFVETKKIIDSYYNNGKNLNQLLKNLSEIMYQISLAKTIKSNDKNIAKWAKQVDKKTIQIYYQIMISALRDAKFTPNDKINLEMSVLRIIALDNDINSKKKSLNNGSLSCTQDFHNILSNVNNGQQFTTLISKLKFVDCRNQLLTLAIENNFKYLLTDKNKIKLNKIFENYAQKVVININNDNQKKIVSEFLNDANVRQIQKVFAIKFKQENISEINS